MTTLTGTDGDDVLRGSSDNDTIGGGTGNDALAGGFGNDTYLYARGDGQDSISELVFYDYSVSLDIDSLQFSEGITESDLQLSRDDRDLLIQISGTADSVRVLNQFMPPPHDTPDYVIDRILFSDGSVLLADDINALMLPTGSNDLITGTNSGQLLDALAGNDTIDSKGGNDTLVGGQGNDHLWAGTGSDVYVFARGDGQDVICNESLAASTDIDEIQFTGDISLNDLEVSRAGEDLMIHLAGSTDTLTLYRHFTADDGTTYGYSDNGVIRYRHMDYSVDLVRLPDGTVLTTWQLATLLPPTTGDDAITARTGNNLIYALAGNDSVYGKDGNDTVIAGSGDDYVYGANGNDTISGSDGQDYLYGDSGNDGISGGNDNDFIYGGIGKDWLHGRSGNDFISGGFGQDTLLGGAGEDTLAGGVGRDAFAFGQSLTLGADVLQDFSHADGDSILIYGNEIGLGLSGALHASRLAMGDAATTLKQRFVFDSETGNLYYDADGSGSTAAVHFATLALDSGLMAGDIFLV